MQQVMQILAKLDWSPLYISIKTGVVATFFSFFLGIFAARRVVKASDRVKVVADGLLALARIMAYRPQALLLDEPFSAMDYFLKERLRLEMARVLKNYEGLSVLVTHDRDETYQLCDHLLLMHDGHIIASGPTREVFDHPETVEAARLTGCCRTRKYSGIRGGNREYHPGGGSGPDGTAL